MLVNLLPVGASLLDLACGDGTFLREALRAGAKRAVGVEISEAGVLRCVSTGLGVYQGDITEGLMDHPDRSFDMVSLLRTVELLPRPESVLTEMLRVGGAALLTFTNHGHWLKRVQYLLTGEIPGTTDGNLGGSPTRLSLSLLRRCCRRTGIQLKHVIPFPPNLLARSLPSLFARELAVLLVKRDGGGGS